MTRRECEDVRARLAGLTTRERAAQPCIGPDRADLVLAGAAILEAVQEVWPCERVRVADRGLREGRADLADERAPPARPASPPRRPLSMDDEPPRKRMVRLPGGGGDGRAPAQRLKTAKLRTPSSQAWLERQLNDPYVAEAKAKGYRSRAAFKLIEIDEKAAPAAPRHAGDRPRLRAGRLAAGAAGARRGRGGRRRPAAGRSAAAGRASSRPISPSRACGDAAGRAAGRPARPDPLRHGAQHHRPPRDRSPAHHRPDRGGAPTSPRRR